MLKFTKRHEWVKLDGDVAAVGITEHAAKEAGTFISVELPKLGTMLNKGERVAVLTSALVALDALAPASGEIIEVNADVAADPSRINADPHGEGWLYRLCVNDAAWFDGLMDEQAYQQFIAA